MGPKVEEFYHTSHLTCVTYTPFCAVILVLMLYVLTVCDVLGAPDVSDTELIPDLICSYTHTITSHTTVISQIISQFSREISQLSKIRPPPSF